MLYSGVEMNSMIVWMKFLINYELIAFSIYRYKQYLFLEYQSKYTDMYMTYPRLK